MESLLIFILFVTLFLAYTNGANDNFKGVATLWGSSTTHYRGALFWATATTFAGSLAALFLSSRLINSFSGKGLVPDSIILKPEFLIAVGLGAALTILIATISGIPISTTHSLTGALLGSGLVAAGSAVNFSTLGKSFLIPLLVTPFIAVSLSAFIYPLFRIMRVRLGVAKQMCICLNGKEETILMQPTGTAVLKSSGIAVTVDQLQNCIQRYQGILFGIDCQRLLDKLHYLSAGAVSFARGLNDTPKIVALLLVTKYLNIPGGLLLVGVAMAIGGLLSAKRVASTMSYRITGMNHGQGFTANLVTAFLVIVASGFGVPASTTHVSCGSLFGIGLVNKRAHWRMISVILAAWIITLPLAGILSGVIYFCLIKSKTIGPF